jgi:hypothetical protein
LAVAKALGSVLEDGGAVMRGRLMKLLFGPNWGMVRRKADGSLETINRPKPREMETVSVHRVFTVTREAR